MKENYFAGKIVIVTGARQGIGKTLTRMLADKGSRLVINSRNIEGLSELKAELEASGCEVAVVPGDISDENVCKNIAESAIKRFGRIDILINNAGIAGAGAVAEAETIVFRRQVEVNLLGSYYMTKWALPHITAANGNILFVSSLAGLFGLPVYSGYSSSKMALTALSRSLKSELHGKGVSIGIAYVGFTENDPSKKQYRPDGELAPLPDRHVKRVTMDRTAELILRQIRKRKFSSVHSVLGKAENLISKFFPSLVELILRKSGTR